MSFSASAKRVRDTSEPIPRRIMFLHSALENWGPFGFDGTLSRLLVMLNVDGNEWTEEQLLVAVDILFDARESWVEHVHYMEALIRSQKKARVPLASSSWREWKRTWLQQYFVGSVAELWLIPKMGSCTACGHAFICHGFQPCLDCALSEKIKWEQACRKNIPLSK